MFCTSSMQNYFAAPLAPGECVETTSTTTTTVNGQTSTESTRGLFAIRMEDFVAQETIGMALEN